MFSHCNVNRFHFKLILATPCAFLAQDYALLPRLSRHLEADDCLVIPRTWIVKFFVSSDVLTFMAQLAGTALTVVGAFIEEYANIGRIVSRYRACRGYDNYSCSVTSGTCIAPKGPPCGSDSTSYMLLRFHYRLCHFCQTLVSTQFLARVANLKNSVKQTTS